MKSRTEVEKIVDSILIKLLRVDSEEVLTAGREKTPGWSSLMHIEIFFALEEEFGIRFDDNAMAFSDSRSELVDAIIDAIAK